MRINLHPVVIPQPLERALRRVPQDNQRRQLTVCSLMAQLYKARWEAEIDGSLEHGFPLAVQFGVHQAGYESGLAVSSCSSKVYAVIHMGLPRDSCVHEDLPTESSSVCGPDGKDGILAGIVVQNRIC